MEGSCRLGAETTAVVEGAEAADIPFETGSSLSKRDTACNPHMNCHSSHRLFADAALVTMSLLGFR